MLPAGAGPFGLPLASPSSYVRLPIAHADAQAALVERPERERQYADAVHLDQRVQSDVLATRQGARAPGAELEDGSGGVGYIPHWQAADAARRDKLGSVEDLLGFSTQSIDHARALERERAPREDEEGVADSEGQEEVDSSIQEPGPSTRNFR